MDSNMSAAAFMHRSGGSSSTSSTGTGSSAGGPGNGSTGGSRMAVIGVTRNVRLRRRGASGFGFSLRGGREYAAGFYVSDVQPGGEAHRNGLRVGDQIIRVNGYPVEDAVHHEVALLAKNQQVLVLKIRSVGMIPVKDNPNDPVTWHMVQQQQQQHQHQQYQQQIQYNESNPIPYNEVRVRVMVGEKGRLGCGVCRGLVPGLTVQGTREGGPARAAGLKAGDVITWCNGQRLTDLPFERAIEIMRGAAILDLILNRPIPPSNGLYDCPETLWMRGSSGYDSESSSLLTTSPSPPAHQNPPSPQHHHNHHHNVHPQSRYTRERDDPCNNRNGRACCPLALSTNSGSSSEWSHPSDQSPEWTRRPNNTTVIRVNQNNHLNNENQYHSNASGGDGGTSSSMVHPTNNTNHVNYGLQSETGNEPLYDPVPPRDYESHDFDANPVEERNRRLLYEKESIDLYDPPASEDHHHHHHYNNSNNSYMGNGHSNIIQRHGEIERQTVTTVEVHQNCGPPAPPCPPPMSYKWQSEAKPMISMGKQMGSTMSMGSTGSTETESSLESCGKDSASTSSSLSTSSCDPASTITSGSTNTLSTGTIKSPEAPVFNRFAVISNSNNSAAGRPSPPVSSTDLSTAIAQEFQRRAQQRNLNAAKSEMNKMEKPIFESKKPKIPPENKVTHDKLMEEFKRAHKKMFNGNQQKVQFSDQFSEKEQEKRVVNDSPAIKGGGTPPPPPMPLPTSPLKSINNNVNGNNIINNNNNNNNNNNSKEDLVEMQSIESFKLKESPSSVIPKPPPTYFSTSDSSSPNSTPSNGSPRHSALLTKTQINNTTTTNINQQTMEKNIKTNSSSPTTTSTGSTGSTGNGKVAVKIGAYEGEAKQPSRFDFLPQQQRTVTDSVTKPAVGGEVINVTNAPVVSRLQNELAATLQRSNLRKKTNQENVSTTQMTKSPSPESINRPVTLLQNNVEKLAAALSNRVTIKLSPENESR